MEQVDEMELKLFNPASFHAISKEDAMKTRKTMKKVQELAENSVADPTKQETFQLDKVAMSRTLDDDVVVARLPGITNEMVADSLKKDNDTN